MSRTVTIIFTLFLFRSIAPLAAQSTTTQEPAAQAISLADLEKKIGRAHV